MDFSPSPRAAELTARVRRFVDEEIAPVEAKLARERAGAPRHGDWTRWQEPPAVEELKQRAREAGLWNLFLSDPELGAGLPTLEYAPLAEAMGRSFLAPEVFNCNAPDSGNMELLAAHGTAEQKARWLRPLLSGSIRSSFCMSEPEVASSDPTQLSATIRREGDELVLDGRKWWSTGLGHPRCELLVFLGRSEPDEGSSRHRRHSLVLVPRDAPGVRIERMLTVLGDYDPPYGHGELTFTDVRVPSSALVGGPGRGFELAQARLGPGRVHHCMRAIGAAERALELFVRRGLERRAFGAPLLDLGGNRERLADLRVAIDQARLFVLHAAWKLDRVGGAAAAAEISAIKLVAPSVLERAVDAAIQIHGGAGLSDDSPLAGLLGIAKALRIADGPDEVHRVVIARAEVARVAAAAAARAANAAK
jgi:acyl-CoA dehydrogenase